MNIVHKLFSVTLFTLFITLATPLGAEVPITGKVTDNRGQALAKARVLLLPATELYDEGRLLLTGDLPEPVAEMETDGAGFFRLVAPEEGMWDVRVERKAFAPLLYQLRPLLKATELPVVEMPRASKLAIKLRDAAGKPLVAKVWAKEGGEEKGVRYINYGRREWQPAPLWGATAEDGTLDIFPSAKESWTLEVAAPEHVALRTEVKAGQRRFERTLERGVPLTFNVVDQERSKALAEVLVYRENWTLPNSLTDAEGRAVLHVEPGEGVDVRLFGGEGHAGNRKLEAPKPKRPQTPTIELQAPQTLSGQVVDRVSREPIAGAVVWTPNLEAWAIADGGGTYQLSLPASSGWMLLAAARDHAGVRQRMEGKVERGPTIALPPAAAIAGVVVDGEDRPVADVELEVIKDIGRRSRASWTELANAWHGRTGAQGRFRIDGLPLENVYQLEMRKPGYATIKEEVEELTASRHDLRLVLPQGIRAVGQVVDEQDQPIAGATVGLFPRVAKSDLQRLRFLFTGNGEEVEGALLTDAQGRFTTDDLSAGRYDLEARAPGFAPASAPGIEVPAGIAEMDLGVIVLGPAAAIEGRVVDPSGKAIVEAVIRAKAEGQGVSARVIGFILEREEPKASSGKDGSFAVEDQRPGDRVHLHVSKEGYVSTTVAGISAPTEQPIEVVLRLGSRILGRVIDSSGAPIAKASLQVKSEGKAGSRLRGMGKFATTDDEGHFEIRSVEPGLTTVMVQAQGYQRQQLSGLEVPEKGALEGVDFTLEPGATVRGLVKDNQGKAVIGATVMIGTGNGFSNNEGFAQTDGEGRFEFTGISSGPKVVSANDDGGRRATANLEVENEEHTVELAFSGGTEVSGRVVDGTGLPVSGARVVLYPNTRNFVFGMGELADESDAQGAFRVSEVPVGAYTVRASKTGFSDYRSEEPFEVATTPVAGLELVLGEGATLSGQIHGLEYDDLVRVEVSVRGAGIRSVRPDFEGRYQVSNVPVGTWTVRAELAASGRQAKGEVTVEEGVSELSLDLEFGGGYLLTGTVRHGEEPLPEAMVRISGASWSGRATTIHDGTFSIDGVEAGTYDLVVRTFGAGVSHQQEIEINGDEDLLIDLATGRLSGNVRDATGGPLEGAEITLESSDDTGSWSFGGRARSDVNGFFNLGQVVEGNWRITANKAGYAPANQVVEVRPGIDLRDLDLVLEPTERLRFRVLTAQGAAPGSVNIAILDASGARMMGGFFETTQEGRVEITTAPKGSWEMLIQADGTGTMSVQATVPGDLGQLILPAAGRLTINFPDLAEEGVVARVRFTGTDGRLYRRLNWRGNPETEFYLRRGKLTLNSLPQGSWQVAVTTDDGRSWSGSAVVQSGATATLDLP